MAQPDEWQPILEFSDRGSAEAVAAILGTEGVPTCIEPRRLTAGIEARFDVAVQASLVHRARWVLALSEFTDEELNFLATGELPNPKE